ncbi:MAG TPA: VOC family protein [Candidatus Solibacter sp.]|nr:VOC family protein [Candidatus Solibacter sp.]
MPKRSLNPGPDNVKQVEQLNKAVDAMLARTDGKAPKAERAIEPLLRIAADLRDLPRESFRSRLKSEFEGRKHMSTVAEPVAATRITAAPRLAFRDPAKAIEFYTRALGAKETFRFQVGDSIPHAELMIGESPIDVTGEWPEGGRFSAETLGNSPISISIQVPDVDGFAQHAVSEGMKLIREPKTQFYGHRDATLQDPFGYTWAVFTVKEEMSVEEMHRRMRGPSPAPEGGREGGQKEKAPGVSPVPEGFRMVTPYMIATDGPALVDFAKQVFDAEETFRAITPAGGLHAEVRIGDSMLMIGGGIPGKEFKGTPNRHALHVYVRDIDAVTKKAVAAGGTLLDEPRDQEYGERSSTVKDSAGNYWYIATFMGSDYRSEGAPDIQPYLHPQRAEPVINFLKRAFNAQELGRYASPDGVIHHVTMNIGDSHIEMGEAHGKYEPIPTMFYLYVPNVDDAYKTALAAGAKSMKEPADQPYGDRVGAVTDAFGNQWWIATHVKDVPAY